MELDVVFSFDTTGSMYPCLAEVRRRVAETVKTLFEDIPGIRIGIIAHGDYCDIDNPYVIDGLGLTGDKESVVHFIKSVKPTNGGDAPECYELVLNRAHTLMRWREDARKVFVMIGDATPHPVGYRWGSVVNRLNWREEANTLTKGDVTLYAVQCLKRSSYYESNSFWNALGAINGAYLELHQFKNIVELIHAVCYRQLGEDRLVQYENELRDSLTLNRGIATFIDTLLGRRVSTADVAFGESDLEAVEPGRFQILHVDERIGIKDFVLKTGARFKVGRGFYEHTKTETIQERKEVVLVHKKSGDMFSGRKAREMIGVPFGTRDRIRPARLPEYDVFIQSTSWNRILVPGTRFLYETE
jgi:hypothetical protein